MRQTLQHTLGAIVLYGLFWGTKQAAFLGLATPGPVYKGLAAFFSFYVEAGLLICIFFCGQVLSGAPRHQWACRLRSLQRSAVVEVGPAELEASIRGGGAVILDIFAIWCFGLKSQLFFLVSVSIWTSQDSRDPTTTVAERQYLRIF